MVNKELASIFAAIADLLEIKGEQPFRINAYRRTARTLDDLTTDIRELAASGGLAKLPGIGKSTVEKIEEYLAKGAISKHQEILQSIPPGLPALLKISGLGPKKIALFWRDLGIENLEDLKRTIADETLAKLKGMGAKSVAQIVAGINVLERAKGQTPLGLAWPLAVELRDRMAKVQSVKRAEIGGSVRRGCETVSNLDLLCESEQGKAVIEVFTLLPTVKRVLAAEETKGSVIIARRDGEDIQVNCRVVPTESFGAAWQYFTGNKEHNTKLQELAHKKKWKINEYGLFSGTKQIAGDDEAELYAKLGLPHIPPELRKDRGELDGDTLPTLIELDDIRGDMHLHTTASDGTAGAKIMANVAHNRGYEYIAITDHSRSSTIANGLSIDKMWRQIELLRRLNEELSAVTILVGCECDILSNGKLDYPDQILAACDYVVASIHSAMGQDRQKVTARTLGAMENPYVSAIGHPTGRLINKRNPMDLDMAAVVAKASETHTALELNAAWQRLDLHDRHLRMARDAGVMLVLGTDSHSVAQYDQMKLGIMTARRGWVRAEDVLNTRPLPAVRKWLAKKRDRA